MLNNKYLRIGLWGLSLVLFIYLFHYVLVIVHYTIDYLKDKDYDVGLKHVAIYFAIFLVLSAFVYFFEYIIEKIKMQSLLNKKCKLIIMFIFTLISLILIFLLTTRKDTIFNTHYVATELKPPMINDDPNINILLYSKNIKNKEIAYLYQDSIQEINSLINLALAGNNKKRFDLYLITPTNLEDITAMVEIFKNSRKDTRIIIEHDTSTKNYNINIISDGKWITDITHGRIEGVPYMVSFVAANLKPLIYYSLGEFAYRAHDFEQAEKHFGEALRLCYSDSLAKNYIRNKSLAKLYYNIALVYKAWANEPNNKNYNCYPTAFAYVQESKSLDANDSILALELALQYESFRRSLLTENNAWLPKEVICGNYENYKAFVRNWDLYYKKGRLSRKILEEVSLAPGKVISELNEIEKNIYITKIKCENHF